MFKANRTGSFELYIESLEQMHEQLIGSLKSDGVIIGITQNPEALHRFMTAGPELTRIVDEFEQSNNCTADLKQHEQYSKFQGRC